MKDDSNIYVLCTVSWGLDALQRMATALPIKGLISLTPRPGSDAISGYVDVPAFCKERGYDCVTVQSYSLHEDSDRRRLLDIDIDLLLVLGWQRLIPEWLIGHARLGAIGVHGSGRGIAGGRGRSPQNWALMLGADRFELSIFFIEPGVDSGDVIQTRAYPLTVHDDIATSYQKVAWLTAEMILESWRNGAIRERRAKPQTGIERYLPRRRPEDGEIDWRRSATEIHDFVRALTRPYPGAFSRFGQRTVKVWRVRPFELPEIDLDAYVPGEVVCLSVDGTLFVRCGDGVVLIDDHSDLSAGRERPLRAGDRLSSASFADQVAAIVESHRERYPDFPIAEDVLRVAGGDADGDADG